jgi:predicted dithiol-disulfide oxidoreductase (DUF899 family)
MGFPNETKSHRVARDRVLEMEVALRRAMEAVAVARRALPPGGLVPEDYAFRGRRPDGSTGAVNLSEQFTVGDTLVVYSFMFPRSAGDDRPGPRVGATAGLPLHEGPCASCTALLDQLDRAMRHLAHRLDLVVVAKTSIDRLTAFAGERGWEHLRLLSSEGSTFKRDYGGEDARGAQQPMLNVFQRSADGIRHFWSSELLHAPMDPNQEMRHLGTIEPMWNLLDFTPAGRGTTEEQLQYACCGAQATTAHHVARSGSSSGGHVHV